MNNNNSDQNELKWWEKKSGVTKQQKEKAKEKKDIRKNRREQEKSLENKSGKNSEKKFDAANKAQVSANSKSQKTYSRNSKNKSAKAPLRAVHTATFENSLFNLDSVPEDAKKILNDFERILLANTPLTSKQRSLLPDQIRSLSHSLTDERNERHLSYMNQTTTLSAYIHYFMWWNLIRLTRVFANLPEDYFSFISNNSENDKTICLDLGSGPLTLPLALFLSRPELRTKKLVWYCMDISSQALSEGENIFLTAAAQLKCEPWQIIRVKGELGTSLKEKVRFVTCGNAFNEMIQDKQMPPDFLAKKFSDQLLSYIDPKDNDAHIFLVEPGVPSSARFISLMRAALLRKYYTVCAPCPHIEECPMEGKKGGKWCNLCFSTQDAPKDLKHLSEKADLPKERGVLTFIALKKCPGLNKKDSPEETKNDAPALLGQYKNLTFRIASDPIRLPGGRKGYYACSYQGLLLVETQNNLNSGDLLSVAKPRHDLKIDEKSGAKILNLD